MLQDLKTQLILQFIDCLRKRGMQNIYPSDIVGGLMMISYADVRIALYANPEQMQFVRTG